MSVEKGTTNEPWIERLACHLKTSEYSLSATQKRVAAARQFLIYLAKQGVDIAGATAAHERLFLTRKLNSYRKRHGRAPRSVSENSPARKTDA